MELIAFIVPVGKYIPFPTIGGYWVLTLVTSAIMK